MAKIHFLEVGCADTTIIDSAGYTILIDCFNIEKYVNFLPKSKSILAVFLTHQHYDHFRGLEYLKDNGFGISYIIQSPYERRYSDNSVELDEWNLHNSLVGHFTANGAKLYKPYRQNSFENPWWSIANLKIWIYGPAKSIATKETRELHDASLVVKVMAARTCCFAGDASDESLNWIAKYSNMYCNDILHASHHGSINGADIDFIKKANSIDTIISTESGVHDNVPDAEALKRYNTYTKSNVYRTDKDHSLHWDF
jgi:beta-lactamase superfamily II metal-dependent hydrolase